MNGFQKRFQQKIGSPFKFWANDFKFIYGFHLKQNSSLFLTCFVPIYLISRFNFLWIKLKERHDLLFSYSYVLYDKCTWNKDLYDLSIFRFALANF